MLTNKEIDSTLFLDIETVPRYKTIAEFKKEEPIVYKVWQERYSKDEIGIPETSIAYKEEQERRELFYRGAGGLYTETNQVVCISAGKIVEGEAKLVSYASDHEKEVISAFHSMMEYSKKEGKFQLLGGHNIQGFDIPILIKKFIKYGLKVPEFLYLHKQKPWETCILDTMQMFKFGGTNFTALEMLSGYYFNGSSKLGEVNALSMGDYWYGEGETKDKIKAIKEYCEADVKATMELVKLLGRS